MRTKVPGNESTRANSIKEAKVSWSENSMEWKFQGQKNSREWEFQYKRKFQGPILELFLMGTNWLERNEAYADS